MKRSTIYFILTILYVCIHFGLSSCANVGSPTGGPKDTIPPQIVTVNPGHGTLNFNETVLRMEFNEPVQLKDLNNQLIITPSIDGKYKTKLSKNSLELQFEQPFDTNTTYTLNFRDGVVDLNESNPAKNLIMAFSTGAYLDSLEMKGKVTEVLTGKPVPDAIVTLYRARDTLNTFNSRPYYLQKTNKEGFYHFRNLKVGNYIIYATNDLNKNLKTDPRNEAFGFLKDTIRLTESIDSLKVKILNINTSPIKINNSRPAGPYYEITLNKAITDYSLNPMESIDSQLFSNPIDNNKKIRIYNTFPIKDSLGVAFTASDSIGQQLQDTLYIRFEESRRAKEEFKLTLNPKSGSAIQESFTATINFNKPVKRINHDSLFFQYDSLTIVRPDTASGFTWNPRRDILTIQTKLSASQPLAKVEPATENLTDNVLPAGPRTVTLYLGKTAFISVDKDSSALNNAKYTFADPKNFGTISGTVDIAEENFNLQLLQAGNYSVVQELKNQKDFTFRLVPPGDYLLRVLVDENGNGKWDPGNVNKMEEPEPVIILKDKITLKTNWELKDIRIGE